MSAQITAFPGPARDDAGKGLEMILEKRGLGSDFSQSKSSALIEDTIKAIEKGWSIYHNEEFSGQVGPPGDVKVIEISGNRGFYAKVNYLSPNKEQNRRRAQIRVTIPLKPEVDGLDKQGTPELRTIAESLESIGYRPTKATLYKT